MFGRTPPEAVQAFIETLQLSVSCLTDSVVTVRGGYYPAVQPHRLTLGTGEYHRMAGGDLTLSLIIFYRIIETIESQGRWGVAITTYYYSFADSDLQEILTYHYHPNQRSNIHSPHMHLESGAMVGREDVANAHLPTGWVSLTDVIQLAITDLNVTPRRDDWQDILEQARSQERLLRPL